MNLGCSLVLDMATEIIILIGIDGVSGLVLHGRGCTWVTRSSWGSGYISYDD